jgi:hypothetical protein
MKKNQKVSKNTKNSNLKVSRDYFSKGKGLFYLSLALLLIAYGFGTISFFLLSVLLGGLFALKGLLVFFSD